MNVGSFSTGISWEYLEKDRNGKHVDQSNNPLFVTAKFETLKQEIFNYEYITIKQYREEISMKANAFHQTKLVRSIKAYQDKYKYQYLRRYGIAVDHVISKERLISMILYSDYTALSSEFSATFRRKSQFEPLTRTKQRHRNYYWMSRLLRETVAVYGQSNHWDNPNGKLGGPFFCGMSMVMNMPQFAMTLFSPTSTSCHMEVALKFAGEEGMIVEFMTSEEVNAKELKGLDLSWISRYKEEDERYGIVFYSCYFQIFNIQIIFW